MTTGSFAQRGEVGSFTNAIECAPSANFADVEAVTIFITVGSIETELTKIRGCHPSLFAARNPWIANCGVANSTSVFAPAAFSLATCDETFVSVSA